jgi:hypothetical protein
VKRIFLIIFCSLAAISIVALLWTILPIHQMTYVYPLDTSHSGSNQVILTVPRAVRAGEPARVTLSVLTTDTAQGRSVRTWWDFTNATLAPDGEILAPLHDGETKLTWTIVATGTAEGTFWLSIVDSNGDQPILAPKMTVRTVSYFGMPADRLRWVAGITAMLAALLCWLLRRNS